MKLYKLTNSDDETHNGMKWVIGVTNHATGKGKPRLCSDTVIHAYTTLLLAELMNPVHGHYDEYKLAYEAEGDIVVSDGTKVGCLSLTITKRVETPTVSTTNRIAFGILCVLEVNKGESFALWAEEWLTNKDRSYAAADAAANAAATTYANAAAAANAAAYAAYAAAAADVAAYAAADVAAYARDAAFTINFAALAEKALLCQ
jgi:hypothetical protein